MEGWNPGAERVMLINELSVWKLKTHLRNGRRVLIQYMSYITYCYITSMFMDIDICLYIHLHMLSYIIIYHMVSIPTAGEGACGSPALLGDEPLLRPAGRAAPRGQLKRCFATGNALKKPWNTMEFH